MNKSFLLLFITIILVTGSSSILRKTSVQEYAIGDKVADFELKNVDGQMVKLTSLNNSKGCILVFTCNHCPCAAKYEDRIIALDKKYKALGYPVLAINSSDLVQYSSETIPRMKARASFKKYTFPYLRDEDQAVAAAFGAPSTPFVYVLQKKATDFIVKYKGAIDDNMGDASLAKEKYVENAIDLLLAGKEVNRTTTNAFGCSLTIRKKG